MDVADRGRRRRDLALLCLLAAGLLLPDLGGPRLWADEGDTAVFARTILARGLPYAWDGRTFTESDRGVRLNGNLVMVGTPWLPFYVTAASFAVLGPSAFAARLPFALCGVACVALLYLLVETLTRDRRAAATAALLLLGSVPFLLFARQCRHYALNALLTVATLLGFVRLRERPRAPLFATAAVLLFYAHPLPAAATWAATGAAAFGLKGFRAARRPYLAWLAVVLASTLPWLVVGWGGVQENARLLARLLELPSRLAQVGIESAESVPWLGWLALAAVLARRREAVHPRDRELLGLALLGLAAFAALLAASLSAYDLSVLGLRYAVGVLPLAAAVTGVLAVRAAGASSVRLVLLCAVFVLTHLPGASLLYAASAAVSAPLAGGVQLHRPRRPLERWLRAEWLGYLLELHESTPGSVSDIVDFLALHAHRGDLLVTNYEWEPLAFHTGLPQAFKVLPSYPILDAARRAGLPEYVFDAADARFVVWRWPWEGYQDYRFDAVRRAIEARGRHLEPVASVHETVWENRPELFFHRFPRLGYLYPGDMVRVGYGRARAATIYRVVDGAPPQAAETGP